MIVDPKSTPPHTHTSTRTHGMQRITHEGREVREMRCLISHILANSFTASLTDKPRTGAALELLDVFLLNIFSNSVFAA